MTLSYLSLHRVGNHRKVPPTPTNDDRMRAFRALSPVQFGNTWFTPARASQPLSKCAASGTYDPDPPTPEEVEEAYRFKYGLD